MLNIYLSASDTLFPNNTATLTKWPCDGPRWFKLKKDVKMSKRCQTVKKMSNVKKSNTQTMEEVHQKK